MNRLVLGIVGSMLVVGNANAITGSELYKMCDKQMGPAGDAGCMGYIHGVIDGLMIGAVANKIFCPPAEGIDATQGRLIVEQFMRVHPENLNQEAGVSAVQAIIATFRCPQ